MGTTYNTAIVRDGLVLHLDAANRKSYPGSGTVWKDLSGLGNNGTLINGVGYSADNNGSMVFDGVNDQVTISHSSLLAPTSSITLSSWVDTNWQTTNSVRILSKTEGGGWQLAINDDPAGSRVGMTIHIGGSYRYATVPKSTISSGYHNIVGTFDGRLMKLHIDASPVVSIDLGSTLSLTYILNNALVIGAEAGASGPANTNFINAKISNVQIYNRALSPLEIQQNFEATRGRYGI